MTPKKSIIVCSIHSFKDPLFNGLIYQYLLGVLQQNPNYLFHVFTEEHPEYKMSPEEQAKVKGDLLQKGIYWYPSTYRKGRLIVLKKIWSFLGVFFTMLRVKWKFKVRLIVGFLVMAGAYAYMASILLRLRLFIFCFEPHSQYMLEFGMWSRSSMKYRILSKIEYREATRANYVVVPTIHTVELLRSWQSKAQIFRVPISVDTDKFIFKPELRHQFRRQYNMDGRYVLLYLGKFNGIYYSETAVARFLKQLIDFDPSIFIFTITPDDTEVVQTAYLAAGLSPNDFVVLDKIPYDQIEGYISACDMGLVAIPPLESQKYRTPVKIGNYLACGLPFVVNRGIADDDILAEKENVGIVLESLDEKDVHQALPLLRTMIDEPRDQQRARCRAAAIAHRGIHNSVAVLEQVFTEAG